MQTEAELIAQILPDLNSVTDAARAGWSPALHDHTLREEIFSNPRLAAWVLGDLLADAGKSTVAQVKADPNPALLAALHSVLRIDADRLKTCAGLVCHANQLAHLVSTNAISLAETEWAMADIRFALAHRTLGQAPDVTDTCFTTVVSSSGTACLMAWLTHLPTRLRSALSVSTCPLGQLCRQTDSHGIKAPLAETPDQPAQATRQRRNLLPFLSRPKPQATASSPRPKHDRAGIIDLCIDHLGHAK